MQNPESKTNTMPLRVSEPMIVSDVRDLPERRGKLAGKAAIVTGSTSGIGLGIAEALARSGANVVLNGFGDAMQIEKTRSGLAQRTNAKIVYSPADMSKPRAIEHMVRQTADTFGAVDIMVNNAGIGIRKRPEEYTLDEYRRIMDTNLTAVFLCCQAAYRPMRDGGGGKIVNIGSMTSIFGHPFAMPYAASKGGVVQLTRSLAISWAPDNIQANCIAPGFILTDLNRNFLGVEPRLSWITSRTPAGKMGDPADVAGTAIYLASDASNYVTGQVIAVDGGFLAGSDWG